MYHSCAHLQNQRAVKYYNIFNSNFHLKAVFHVQFVRCNARTIKIASPSSFPPLFLAPVRVLFLTRSLSQCFVRGRARNRHPTNGSDSSAAPARWGKPLGMDLAVSGKKPTKCARFLGRRADFCHTIMERKLLSERESERAIRFLRVGQARVACYVM